MCNDLPWKRSVFTSESVIDIELSCGIRRNWQNGRGNHQASGLCQDVPAIPTVGVMMMMMMMTPTSHTTRTIQQQQQHDNNNKPTSTQNHESRKCNWRHSASNYNCLYNGRYSVTETDTW